MTAVEPAVVAAAALDVRNVSRRFPNGTEALDDVSLSVAPGELVAVVGPSGCGKSTLLRLISGLDRPTAGTVERAPGNLGYVFQDATLLPWRTVRDNVELFAELHHLPASERSAAADRAIALTGLSGFEGHHPRQLSGGMRMRVSLARSLTLRPSVFLFDEPFGSLDELTRERLNGELLDLFAARAVRRRLRHPLDRGGDLPGVSGDRHVPPAGPVHRRVPGPVPLPARSGASLCPRVRDPRGRGLGQPSGGARMSVEGIDRSLAIPATAAEAASGTRPRIAVRATRSRSAAGGRAAAPGPRRGHRRVVRDLVPRARAEQALPAAGARPVITTGFLDPINFGRILEGLVTTATVAVVGLAIATVIGIGTAIADEPGALGRALDLPLGRRPADDPDPRGRAAHRLLVRLRVPAAGSSSAS